jgi:hypothetical protein
LTLLNFSGHEGSGGTWEGQTDPLHPSDNSGLPLRPERNSRTPLSPSTALHSDPGQNASRVGTSRPSVIVYKVATGPNLAISKDVIRVSYGERNRKRNRMKRLGHVSKKQDPGRHITPLKERDKAKGDDAAKHPGRRLSRIEFCLDERRASPVGLKTAGKKPPGKPPSAERVEGDMAWDFGVGSQTFTRHVDVHRPQVRVGGLTSVRMIPRTVIDGEIGPGVTRPST